MGRVLSLDTVLSASEHFLSRWSTGIESNKAGRVLRYLMNRLWDQGQGKLITAELTLAQTTIARRLGISRQWVGILVERLSAAGWLEYHSSKLANGTNSSSVWRIGRMMKRLLIMLGKSKKRGESPAKCNWLFSPLHREKRHFLIQQKEKEPPSVEALQRIPLLRLWMERG